MQDCQLNVFLGLGSNIGNREYFLSKAVQLIEENERIKIVKRSSLYETEPWREKKQDYFLNQVLEIKTRLNPVCLFEEIKNIESEIGSKKGVKWGPRKIDIDILLYGMTTINTKELTIPHIYLTERKFVLIPLKEIAPDLTLPNQKKIDDLLHHCKDSGKVLLYKKVKSGGL